MRHPRTVLAVAAILLVTLGVIGTSVESRLDPTTVEVPGTPAAEANAMLRDHFGPTAPFAILLEGPPAAIDRQGPRLVRELRLDPEVTTLSPWDRGRVDRRRPRPDRALILADFHVDTRTAVNETVPELEAILEDRIHAPIEATQTGFATLSRSIQQESIDASERGELLALPFLLIVLLLVFRSPVAAAIPLAFGAITVVASRGILYFFTGWFDIDAFALAVCTMMGLALGVDYALLMVSRFREELAAGTPPAAAARVTRRHAGRTVGFAGSTLVLSMLVSLFILPGSLLASLAGTLMMVVLLSVGVATILGPALLTLIGTNVDRWRIGPAPNESSSRLMRTVNAALKRPAAVAALIGAVLLLLAAPAIALKTGPPSPEQLAKDAPARVDAERIDDAIGPGWDAPFQVVAVNDEGPITDGRSLAALTEFQEELAALPGVQAVIGPSEATERVKPLQELGNAVLTSDGNIGPVKELGRLGRSLGVAAGGVGELREGIAEASDGAGLLALGSDRAGEGAELIALGLARAASGSQRAIDALERFSTASRKLEEALQEAALGAQNIRSGLLVSLVPVLRQSGLKTSREMEARLRALADETLPSLIGPATVADEQLKAALVQLQAMTVGQTDPAYPAALAAVQKALAAVSGTDPATGQPYAPEYTGLPAELTALQATLLEEVEEADKVSDYIGSTISTMEQIGQGAKKLTKALYAMHKGANRLANGSEQLAGAAGQLGQGIERLSGGATALVGGLARLTGGAEAMEAGLAAGFEEAAPLESGLDEASVRVLDGKKRINNQASRVAEGTPNLFNSGFFVLSALDGGPPKQRVAAAAAIDLKRGGQAASVLVVSDYSFNTPGSIRLNKVLDTEAERLAESSGLQAGVAGGAAQLNDYTQVTRERIPWVIAAITFVTFLVLIFVLRAVPLAAIAVGLNLATVAVAFGVLTLLFEVPDDWPLGGHSYVDAVGATMIFGVVFGLSIDYAVFLLSRMREHYELHGDNAAAIQFGLDKTARVITGAAAIMLAVFIVFAGAPIATVSQLGVGLTVAVILDATVVRNVLLPALMLLLGDRVWWLPKWLARSMPKVSI
ncbi:MAG: putative drug exporter of the superfamily [Solirubrobacterales bacterium]|nr:putative drug exporter of the superfamily [Solirubrobacterales bacterium]